MRGVGASHYAGLSSENLGEEAILGGCYPGVKQRPGFIRRRRIAISVRGEAERVAELAEHTEDAVRAVREASATRQRAVYKQNFCPATCDLLKSRAQRIWPDRRRDLAPRARYFPLQIERFLPDGPVSSTQYAPHPSCQAKTF